MPLRDLAWFAVLVVSACLWLVASFDVRWNGADLICVAGVLLALRGLYRPRT